MCRLYHLGRSPRELAWQFRLTLDVPLPNFAPSWRIATTDPAPVLRRHPQTGKRRLDVLRWVWFRTGPRCLRETTQIVGLSYRPQSNASGKSSITKECNDSARIPVGPFAYVIRELADQLHSRSQQRQSRFCSAQSSPGVSPGQFFVAW
jgi:hypothetical protein